MKKWIPALFAVLLVWNLILTVNLIHMQNNGGGSGPAINENTVNGYTTDVTEVVSSTQGSVVTIVVRNEESERRSSGIIYGNEENSIYILTGTDILEGADTVAVRFDSGIELSAQVVGRDKVAKVGLLRLEPPFDTLSIKLGDSGLISQGEYVIAMGGRRTDTESAMVTFGIAGTPGERQLNTQSTWTCDVIESDIIVTSNDIGGPLLNISGELLGMIVATPMGGSASMGYAISVNELRLIFAQLKEGKDVQRGALGTTVRSINTLRAYQKSARNIRLDMTTGVLITNVLAGSAADGILKEGDVLDTMDGETIRDAFDLRTKLYGHKAGDTVVFGMIRDGSSQSVTAVLQ
ncbi:MAG: PDZ domain-containing protein [Solobacterium sp.]|nr:PDZ domain-containing protein [Solobacterium sp.]